VEEESAGEPAAARKRLGAAKGCTDVDCWACSREAVPAIRKLIAATRQAKGREMR
jgi:hypothetical protein